MVDKPLASAYWYWVSITGSIILGLILMVVKLPESVEPYQSNWPLMVLLFWAIHLPLRVGLVTTFAISIITDIMTDHLLGQHALPYLLVIYIVLMFHKRIVLMPLWQQTLAVIILLFVERLASAMLIGVIKGTAPDMSFWYSPLSAVITWPLLRIFLRALL